MRVGKLCVLWVVGQIWWYCPAYAQSVIASWNEVVEDVEGNPEEISGYHIYYGNNPGGPYDQGISAEKATQVQIDNLDNGLVYYFAVKATDMKGKESAFSLEVSYSVPFEDCNNLTDDDHDGLIDCQDLECPNVDEACDGFDNNCNGSIDEGCPCSPDQSRACSTDVGVCEIGVQVCNQQGEWGPCSGVLPTAEVCDGLDNNCDGRTDNGIEGPSCELRLGVCEGVERICGGASGWLDCDYGDAYEQTETICDGLDNDCNGRTDEELVAPVCVLNQGVCLGVTRDCGGAAGWLECNYGPDYEQVESRCDELDNDCDGQVDEDQVCDEQPQPIEPVVEGGMGCASGPGKTGDLGLLGLYGLLWLLMWRRLSARG